MCRLFAASFCDSDSTPSRDLVKEVNTGPEASSSKKPKASMHVKYELHIGQGNTATALSKQLKRQGKYDNWINVQADREEEPSSVNWDEVIRWEPLPGEEMTILLTAHEKMSQALITAKEREIQNLRDNDVFEVVEEQQPLVSCKWIFTEKVKNGKKVVKTTLVTTAFDEKGHNARTDSPTCSHHSLIITFVTAAIMKWTLQSRDISSAFLQGNGI